MVQLLYLLKYVLTGSRRDECTGQIVKYWYQIMHLDIEYPVKQCYEWQEHKMDSESLDYGVERGTV